MGKRWPRRIVITLMALVLCVGGLLGLLQTPWAGRWILDRARGGIQKSIQSNLRAGGVRLNLFEGSIQLSDLSVRSARAPELPPFLEADRLYVNINLLSALQGDWVIEALSLDSPRIHLFTGADGDTNLPEIEGSTGSGPEVRILHATASNGSFRLKDLPRELLVELPEWTLQVDGSDRPAAHRIRFSLQREAPDIEYGEGRVPLRALDFAGVLEKSVLRIDSARIVAAGSSLGLKGTVRNFSNPEFNLDLHPELDASGIAAAAGYREKIGGIVSGSIQVRGSAESIRVAAALRGSEVQTTFLPHLSFRLSTDLQRDAAAQRIDVLKFRMDSPVGAIGAKGGLYTGSGNGSSALEADILDLQLRPFSKLLGLPFDLASRARGTVSAEWRGAFSPSSLHARATLRLSPTQAAPGSNLLPVSATAKARFASNRLRVHIDTLSALEIEASGDLETQSFQTIDGNLRGEVSDLDASLRQIALLTGTPGESLIGVQADGHIQFALQSSGNLRHPEITAQLHAPALEIAGLKHLATEAEAVYKDARIEFRDQLFLPNNARIESAGWIDLQESEPRLHVAASTTGAVPAEAISTILQSDIPMAGTLATALHLDGPIGNLSGELSLAGEELSIHRIPLGKLDATIDLADQRLHSRRIELTRDPRNPSGDRVTADVSYAIDSGQFQIEARGSALSLRPEQLPDSAPIEGTLELRITGSGTVDNPSIDLALDTDAVRAWERPLGPVSLQARLRGEELRIHSLAPRLSLSSDATLIVRAPYPFQASVRADGTDLSVARLRWRDTPVAGSTTIDIGASGELQHPERSRVAAQIDSFELQSGTLQVRARAPARILYENLYLGVAPPLTLTSGDSTLEISGRIQVKKEASGFNTQSIHDSPFAVDALENHVIPANNATAEETLRIHGRLDLADAAKGFPPPEGFGFAGHLDIDLVIAGIRRAFEIAGAFDMDDGSIAVPKATIPLTNTSIHAKIENGALILDEAAAKWGQGRIVLSGDFPFGLLPDTLPQMLPRAKGPARFTLDIDGLTPESTGYLPEDLSGRISLRAEGEAERTDLRALNAHILFRDLAFNVDAIGFSQNEPLRIDISDGIAVIPGFSLVGPRTNIRAGGSAGLYPDAPLDLHISGSLDAGLIGSFSEDLKTAGDVKIDAAVAGVMRTPVLSGIAEMRNGKLSLPSPRIAADDLDVRLELTSEAIVVREFTGILNGGSMSVEGTVGYRHSLTNDIDLKATIADVFLNAPEGLKSSSSGSLTLKSEEDVLMIGGNLRIMESAYRESIGVGSGLVNYLKSQQMITLDEEPNPFLDRLRFNVSIRTVTPLLVQNNIARVEASATNLRLVGSFNEPSLLGRITLNEGGEILLNQQTYYINRGMITLVNQSRIEPELNIQAQTKVDIYEITLQLVGNPDGLSTILSSDPPLSERDILSLLLTGKTIAETQGREMQMVRSQALSLIAGQAGEGVTNEARKALHLSTFRIDPGMIASESNPGARLTLGEDITRALSLVYSMNLVNGGDQIWAAQYDIGRRLTTQATKQQDNSYRFEFRHDLRFGGSTRARRGVRTRAHPLEIGSIHFEGADPPGEKTLLEKFKNDPGDRYDFQKIQKGLDRLHEFYFNRNHLEADIRLQRETAEKEVDLKVSIDPGPVVEFDYGEFALRQDVKNKVARAWSDGVFEAERLDEASLAIRRSLTESGFLKAEVAAELKEEEKEEGRKIVRFRIDPGTRYTDVPISFPGAQGIRPGILRELLESSDLDPEIHIKPKAVATFLKSYYQSRGYLKAAVNPPEFRSDPDGGAPEIVIQIQEGPLFVIGDLEFTGNSAFSYDELWMVIPTSSGSSYNPESLRDSIKEMETLYHGKGYNDASITFRVLQDEQKPIANVTFQITERRQSIIRKISVEGTRGTSESFVTRQLDFQVEEPLDYERINETRRRLYATGVYSSVDFQMEELSTDRAGTAAPGPPEIGTGQNPFAQRTAASSLPKNIHVRLRLRETQPYRLQYGLFYDTDRGIGGLLEAQHLNWFGRATNLGFRARYDSDLKEGRLYYHQPFVTRIRLKMDASAFWQQETRSFFSARRIGFSLIQERRLPRDFRFDYGYRYDHVRWNGLPPDPILFQASEPVARLMGTLTRDSRDSVLDPTRGDFISNTFEFGPRWLGSEVGFARYSGQYFRYVPLDKYLGKPIQDRKGQPLPTNFVYAAAVRIGMTSAFGNKALSSPERFFSGGGTTMRGFEQDLLGPVEVQPDGSMRPIGGEAMFLLNNELRFPIVGILQGVGFLDIGNVYAKLTDFDFSMRKSAGVGLRLKIKSIPLRFDYGFKLDRQPGESGSEFFFSIGQAF